VTTRFDEDATIEDVVVACANALKIAEAAPHRTSPDASITPRHPSGRARAP
jgi:hypothetical protein